MVSGVGAITETTNEGGDRSVICSGRFAVKSARQEAVGARKFAILWRAVVACGNLWRPVATDGGALRNLCRLRGPQIIRSSDAGIVGLSGLGVHQWSDLRSSNVWLCCQGLAGQMVDDERNNDEKSDWKKVPRQETRA